MHYTVTKKLATLAGTGLALLLSLGAATAKTSALEQAAARHLSTSTVVMRDSALIDMYHDATFADVYRGVTATDVADLAAITDDVDADLLNLRDALQRASDAGLSPAVAE